MRLRAPLPHDARRSCCPEAPALCVPRLRSHPAHPEPHPKAPLTRLVWRRVLGAPIARTEKLRRAVHRLPGGASTPASTPTQDTLRQRFQNLLVLECAGNHSRYQEPELTRRAAAARRSPPPPDRPAPAPQRAGCGKPMNFIGVFMLKHHPAPPGSLHLQHLCTCPPRNPSPPTPCAPGTHNSLVEGDRK